MAERLLELGEGLELWKARPSEIREQDVNARTMTKEMFDRLTTTIGRDKRLESFPLCATTEKGIELISGHHRVRTAIAANLEFIYILVDVTGLTADQIAAKQLAHNSISGEDDPTLLRQIFSSIRDAEARLEAFVDIKLDNLPTIKTHDIGLQLDYKSVLLLFLPSAKEQFEKIIAELPSKLATIYVCDRDRFEEFRKTVERINKEYDIRSAGTVLAKMCEIVMAELGEPPQYNDAVALRDLFKAAFVPKPIADRIQRALTQLRTNGQVPSGELWRALDRWAQDELGEPGPVTPAASPATTATVDTHVQS